MQAWLEGKQDELCEARLQIFSWYGRQVFLPSEYRKNKKKRVLLFYKLPKNKAFSIAVTGK